MGNCCGAAEQTLKPETKGPYTDDGRKTAPVHERLVNAEPRDDTVTPRKADIEAPPAEVHPPKQPPKPAPAPETPAPPEPVRAPPGPVVTGVVDSASEAFGLLLCGAGESGKTTFTRQMKLRFLGGIDEATRRGYTATIRGNMVESVQVLVAHNERKGIEFPEDLQEAVEQVGHVNAFVDPFTEDLADTIQQLWESDEIKAAFRERDQTIIPDNVEYFFDKINDVKRDDYVPTDDDVLRARIRSIGIEEMTFNVEGAIIRVYDVGGQKNERAKWDQLTSDEIGGVIFCASFADFAKPMFESPEIPRVNDAIDLFATVLAKPMFQTGVPIFFIANKFDRFVETVRTSESFTRAFPDFTGDPHDAEATAAFLTQKFLEKAGPPNPDRPVVVMRQSALDAGAVEENAKSICRYIREHYFE